MIASSVLLLALMGLVYQGSSDAAAAVQRLDVPIPNITVDATQDAEIPMSLETSWKSKRGTETVKTTRQQGETGEEHRKRHDAEVAAQQERWPPIS